MKFSVTGWQKPAEKVKSLLSLISPAILIISLVILWYIICHIQLFPSYQLPSPLEVWNSFGEEFLSGRLINDIIASMWRVTIGFVISACLGIPLGLCLGQFVIVRSALVPILNFFRFLSPLSWIPFAILWFQIGDKPAIFLIFMAAFFPLVLSTTVAVAGIPSIYFRVARDYNYKGIDLLTKVTFPAILPQMISFLRMCYGIAWIVIVAAEMVGCQDGLGYGIWDARNGLKLDTAVTYMITIGLVGILMDRLLALLTNLPNVKWGYER
jgi:NitT/TauT family transport system permease protein